MKQEGKAKNKDCFQNILELFSPEWQIQAGDVAASKSQEVRVWLLRLPAGLPGGSVWDMGPLGSSDPGGSRGGSQGGWCLKNPR